MYMVTNHRVLISIFQAVRCVGFVQSLGCRSVKCKRHKVHVTLVRIVAPNSDHAAKPQSVENQDIAYGVS